VWQAVALPRFARLEAGGLNSNDRKNLGLLYIFLFHVLQNYKDDFTRLDHAHLLLYLVWRLTEMVSVSVFILSFWRITFWFCMDIIR
jgi:hypothetical protein